MRSAARIPEIVHQEPEAIWAERINGALRKSVEGVIEAGRLLIQAKAELPHGGFELMVKSSSLCISPRTAQQLMQIASHPVLANPQHAALLPNAWSTLGELSRIEAPDLELAISNHLIKPELKREDVQKLRRRIARNGAAQTTPRPKRGRAKPSPRQAAERVFRAYLALDKRGSEQFWQLVEQYMEEMADGEQP